MTGNAGSDYWRFRRLSRLRMHTASWTSESEALNRLLDFVRREGRIAISAPKVELMHSRWSGTFWNASIETSEIPSDPSPLPRLHLR